MMLYEWILILTIYAPTGDAGSMQVIEMNSYEACVIAGSKWKDVVMRTYDTKRRWGNREISYVCVKNKLAAEDVK